MKMFYNLGARSFMRKFEIAAAALVSIGKAAIIIKVMICCKYINLSKITKI